ncbi:hypothetical protein FACS1894164_20670 [Spirochaetia bacterium]|nr:hypothetical protein FACS1894164_20670 [Spirochaetia bacterium]
MDKKKPLIFEPVYYYSREHRLQKAPASVRALHTGGVKRSGIFNTLTGTRSNRFMLMTIVILFVFISILTRMTNAIGSYQLGGNSLTLNARTTAGETYLEINKIYKEEAFIGTIKVAVSTPSGNEGITVEQIAFSMLPEEQYRILIPFKAPQYLVVLQMDTGEYISVKVNRRG